MTCLPNIWRTKETSLFIESSRANYEAPIYSGGKEPYAHRHTGSRGRSLPLFAQSSSSYHITHTYVLGGDGSWDYVVPDPPNHRVFIARQNRVMAIDEDSGKLLGEVTSIMGAHGTAIAEKTGTDSQLRGTTSPW